MRAKLLSVSILIVLAGFIYWSTARNHLGDGDISEVPAIDAIASKTVLQKRFYEQGALVVVYDAVDTVLQNKYQQLLTQLVASPKTQSWRPMEVSFQKASEVQIDSIRNKVIYLVGTAVANPLIRKVISEAPFLIVDNAVVVNGKSYAAADAALAVQLHPNPMNPVLPLGFLTGANEERVFQEFANRVRERGRSFFRQALDIEIKNRNQKLLLVNFTEDWKLDSDTFFDFTNAYTVRRSTKHFNFIYDNGVFSADELDALIQKVEGKTKEIIRFTGKVVALPTINYHAYASPEVMGLQTGQVAQAFVDLDKNAVHSIHHPAYAQNEIGKEHSILLYHLLGNAKTKALEIGLPLYFTEYWQHKGYQYWAARLSESSNAIPLKQLLNNEFLALESPLITSCLSATFVQFLIAAWGQDAFLEKYATWVPTMVELNTLQTQWQKYLNLLPSKYPKELRQIDNKSYKQGFNFAHEGYSIYNGYQGSKAIAAINKMKNLGSNYMALVPYTYMRDTSTPTAFSFRSSAGSENDEGLVHSAFLGKEAGIRTLLKPQIYVGDSWPGAIEMKTKKDWGQFFEAYYRWIRHYAFLAEIHQIDALSVGVEFSKATGSHEQEWRDIIKGVRGLFQGQLTYAANWGKEFEELRFWDALDFIGLNCYYPLSEKDTVTKADLTANFNKVKKRIEKVYQKYQKPIVFTEIGFRSSTAPWKNPHAEGDDIFNPKHQQICYEVVFEGIENVSWCGGILWWKFPSYLAYRGVENTAFTPNNKLAEETVNMWFSK